MSSIIKVLNSFICIISFNPHKDTMQWTLLLKEEIKAQRQNYFAHSHKGFNQEPLLQSPESGTPKYAPDVV